MANETEKSFSIKDAASAMGISEATVKAYKATLIKAFEHCKDKVLTEARSLNEYGLEQLKEVQKFHKIGAPDGYIAKVQKEFSATIAPLADDVADSVATKFESTVNVDFEVVSEDFIRPSELAIVNENPIQLPNGFDPTAMVKFFDGVAGQAIDTTSLLAIADLALNAVENAMDQKVEAQRLALEKTENDAKLLAEKVSTAKTDLKIKALESKMLAARQTSAAKDAESVFTELMSLGKPAGKPDAPTSQP